MKLIYSYTTKMGNYTDNEWAMIYYRAAMTVSRRLGYYIKFYGCDYSCEWLKDYADEIVNIQEEDFILTDDLKLWIHQNEDLDSITIDGDLILFNKLNLSKNVDVVFELKGLVNNGKYKSKFNHYLNKLKKYDISNHIKYFDFNGNYVCNVGILKFNNQDVKNLLINSYFKFRDYYLKEIEPHENLVQYGDPAIILCEYNFARICEKENLQIEFARDTNSYKHYMSEEKFSQEFFNHINNIFGNHNNII